MLKVAFLADAEPLRRLGAEFSSQHALEFGGRPGEELALLAFAVRVLRAGKTATVGDHLAQDPVAGLACDGCKALFAGVQEGFEVDGNDQGIVVEHLLEVRNQPLGIGAVAVEAAAELVVDSPVRHALQGVRDHGECIGSTAAIVMSQK